MSKLSVGNDCTEDELPQEWKEIPVIQALLSPFPCAPVQLLDCPLLGMFEALQAADW